MKNIFANPEQVRKMVADETLYEDYIIELNREISESHGVLISEEINHNNLTKERDRFARLDLYLTDDKYYELEQEPGYRNTFFESLTTRFTDAAIIQVLASPAEVYGYVEPKGYTVYANGKSFVDEIVEELPRRYVVTLVDEQSTRLLYVGTDRELVDKIVVVDKLSCLLGDRTKLDLPLLEEGSTITIDTIEDEEVINTERVVLRYEFILRINKAINAAKMMTV